MSCFIVEEKSIGVIASVITDIVNDNLPGVIRDRFNKYGLLIELEPLLKNVKNTWGNTVAGLDYKELCYRLYGLNCRAFGGRYDENTFPAFNVPRKKNAGILISDNIYQLYKTIQCYLYQCSEGAEFMSDPIFKACEKLSHMIADYHITRSPRYDAAEWD